MFNKKNSIFNSFLVIATLFPAEYVFSDEFTPREIKKLRVISSSVLIARAKEKKKLENEVMNDKEKIAEIFHEMDELSEDILPKKAIANQKKQLSNINVSASDSNQNSKSQKILNARNKIEQYKKELNNKLILDTHHKKRYGNKAKTISIIEESSELLDSMESNNIDAKKLMAYKKKYGGIPKKITRELDHQQSKNPTLTTRIEHVE